MFGNAAEKINQNPDSNIELYQKIAEKIKQATDDEPYENQAEIIIQEAIADGEPFDDKMKAYFQQRDVAGEKQFKYGLLSFTAADHHDISSGAPDILLANPDKAHYELLSDKEIEDWLDSDINTALSSEPEGYIKSSAEFLKKTIPFLKSVGRLPQKYEYLAQLLSNKK